MSETETIKWICDDCSGSDESPCVLITPTKDTPKVCPLGVDNVDPATWKPEDPKLKVVIDNLKGVMGAIEGMIDELERGK